MSFTHFLASWSDTNQEGWKVVPIMGCGTKSRVKDGQVNRLGQL